MNFKKIKPTKKDHAVLEKLQNRFGDKKENENQNFKNCVVIKPWGHEYLLYENESVAVWLLKINANHSTSMHCHPLKKTSLVLLSGEALCYTFQGRNHLKPFTGLIMEKTVFHSTKALTPDGIELIEVESPPNKNDLVRVSDAYGRENRGYEGYAEMETKNLRAFNYFCFEEPADKEPQIHYSETYSVALEIFFDNEHLKKSFQIDDKQVYCICRGELLNAENEIILNVGEAVAGWRLKNEKSLATRNGAVFLKIRGKDYENS